MQLTAGQIKAQRQDRLNAERAVREAVRQPERAAAGAQARAERAASSAQHRGRTDAAPRSPIPWITVALQFICLAYVSARFRSALVFMIGTLWLGYRLMTRRFGWASFLLPLLAFAVMTLLL